MGGRGAKSGGFSHFIRQNALTWARNQVGSTQFAKKAELGDWKEGKWKCNAFVIRAFNYNMLPKVIEQKKNPFTLGLTERAYGAREFYQGKVPGFTRVEDPQPGDICADGKHVGIVSGKGRTISASEDRVVENDWGFRPNSPVKPRFYRYTGAHGDEK